MYTYKILSALVLMIILFSFVGCNTYYDKGIKYFNDNKFKEAIEEFNKIKPGESKYEESKEIINNCYYKIAVDFIRNNHVDSALSVLSKINQESKIFTKSKSTISYCEALKSIDYNNQKEAMGFLKEVSSESEFYSDAQKKFEEINKKLSETTYLLIDSKNILFKDYKISIVEKKENKSYSIKIVDKNTSNVLYKSEELFFFTPGNFYPYDLDKDGKTELIIYGSTGGNGGFYNILIFDFKYGTKPVAKLESVGFNPKNDVYNVNDKIGIKIHYRKVSQRLSMAQTPILFYTVLYENGKIFKKD